MLDLHTGLRCDISTNMSRRTRINDPYMIRINITTNITHRIRKTCFKRSGDDIVGDVCSIGRSQLVGEILDEVEYRAPSGQIILLASDDF